MYTEDERNWRGVIYVQTVVEKSGCVCLAIGVAVEPPVLKHQCHRIMMWSRPLGLGLSASIVVEVVFLKLVIGFRSVFKNTAGSSVLWFSTSTTV